MREVVSDRLGWAPLEGRQAALLAVSPGQDLLPEGEMTINELGSCLCPDSWAEHQMD